MGCIDPPPPKLKAHPPDWGPAQPHVYCGAVVVPPGAPTGYVPRLSQVVASAFASYYMAQWLLPQDKEFQNFAFMYGALPVASVSFVFASKYDAFPTVIGGAFILSMMLSPCVMFLQVRCPIRHQVSASVHHKGAGNWRYG